ncbi:MAG: DUF2079 domain-containing protein [Ilumatobacteraceae bacterium]|jgi:uncharacterized membrane protein|nr:DUF2079 domain-containing protein [Ilumatobacteraceae bacterium]
MAKITKQFWGNLRYRVTQITVWQTVTMSAISLVFLYLAAMSVELHRGLNTSAYDFGLYDQGIWLMSQFKSPFVTLMGRNLIGDHTSFILIFLVPFYWLVGSTSFLFVVQALVICAGAIPVFFYTRRKLESEIFATVFAVVYLIHPATIWIGLENYHPDSFLGLFVGVALYAALEKRWRLYFFATLLSLLVKEDVALVVVPLGVWIAIRQNRKIGLLTVLVSFWYMILAMFGIQKGINGVNFRNSWRIPFDGVSGLVKTMFTDPGKLGSYLLSESRPYYLLQMALPVAFVFFLFPEVAVIAILVIGANILSTFWYQFHIEYHYSFVIVPILVFGSVFAIARVSAKYRTILVGVCAATSLFSAFMWAPLPGTRTDITYNGSRHPMVAAATEALDKVPNDAIVSAYHPLTAQIARRERIYSFPVPFKRSLYGLDAFAQGDVLSFVDEIEYVILPKNMDEQMAQVWSGFSSRYEITYANSWWVVYQQIAK